MRFGKLIVLCFLCLSLSSCADLTEDLTQAKALMDSQDYEQAIQVLHGFKGKSSQKLLSQAYLSYGVQQLKEINQEKKLRYEQAKNNFEKALDLDPKNKEARDLYQMIIKAEAVEISKS